MAEATSPSPAGPLNGNGRARTSRPPRPNYRDIHRFPLPVTIHNVPSVIPHNPLSLISVALSYLSCLISPPRKELYTAYFDSATSAVHVTDEKTINALWRMGFFGKGNLSRSEPSWLEREKKRRGYLGGNTSEEATRKRRAERRELKLERARVERQMIEERLKAEAAARESGSMASDGGDAVPAHPTLEKFSVKKAMEAKYQQKRQPAQQNGSVTHPDGTSQASNGKAVRFSPVVETKELAPQINDDDDDVDIELENEEHLQLSNEETFFLAYSLGALQVVDRETNTVIPTSSLFHRLCHHSHFPPRTGTADLEPDDPFLTSYAVYHHFRSLGWVVRSGVKFGTDYLLYNRGPVFSHAEFAVIIVPSYEHPYWSETQERKDYVARKQDRSWWWLHCVNRVQAHVKKSLAIVYVQIPPPQSSYDDIGGVLGQYRVREFLLRRWIPNRSRD
ncbi:hypothetical protein N7493_010357 [Penicillium malachiteum]|uniref:tRNA-splicing endonuclease subunit Sen2 n=1 Tax=Penicillium malachiteum TaxID=1324776 RepID=A0AAD6HCN3_9EURO|nr:hypothetical protein N7493_010357 [Penicillium malachiteum]